MIDQRTLKISGNFTSAEDNEEVYREICATHEYNLSKARSHTDSQKVFNINGIVKLCLLLNLKITIDGMTEEFTVWYPKKGIKPAKIILDKETDETIKENNPEAVKAEEPEPGITYDKINKDPLPTTTELEDLF